MAGMFSDVNVVTPAFSGASVALSRTLCSELTPSPIPFGAYEKCRARSVRFRRTKEIHMDTILELLGAALDLFGGSDLLESGSAGDLLESGSAMLGSVQ